MKSIQSARQSTGKLSRHSLQFREESRDIKKKSMDMSREKSREMSREMSRRMSREVKEKEDENENETNEEKYDNEMNEEKTEMNYYYDKNGYCYDSEGNYYDEEGNLVAEEYYYDDENGYYYDKAGNCFDEYGNIIPIEESSHSTIKSNLNKTSFSKRIQYKNSDQEKKERTYQRGGGDNQDDVSSKSDMNNIYKNINRENKAKKKSLSNYYDDDYNSNYMKKKKRDKQERNKKVNRYSSYSCSNYPSDYDNDSNSISPRSSYVTKNSYQIKKEEKKRNKKGESEYVKKSREPKKKKKKKDKEICVYEMEGYIPISNERMDSEEWEEKEVYKKNNRRGEERRGQLSDSSKERNHSNKRENEKNVNFILPNPMVTYADPNNVIVCISPNDTMNQIQSNQLLQHSCLNGVEDFASSMIPPRNQIQYIQTNPDLSTNVLPHGYITKGYVPNTASVQVRSYQTTSPMGATTNLSHNLIQPRVIQGINQPNKERCIINSVHAIPNTSVSIPFEKSQMQYFQPNGINGNRNLNNPGMQNMITSKNEFYQPTSIQRNSCQINSSSPTYAKLTQDTGTNDEYVSEITIIKNNEMNPTAKPIMLPNTNRIFVRNRSYTPNKRKETENQQRKKNVSPLKNLSLGTMSSQQSTNNHPICTHEVSYFSNQTSSPSHNTIYVKYPDTDSVVTENSSSKDKTKTKESNNRNNRDITETTVQEEEEEEQTKGKTKQKVSKKNTKLSESSSEGKSKRNWGVQTSLPLMINENEITEKMKHMDLKIDALKKENANLNDMTKLYKNECTRLRELLVKNNITNLSSSKIIETEEYETVNLKLEEENEKLKKQMKSLGKALLNSENINGVKQILAQQIVDLQEENEKYRNKIKVLKKNNDVNHQVLFRLNKTDISADAMDSIFMQTKNIIIQGHESVNVLYLNLKNLIDQLFQKIRNVIKKHEYTDEEKLSYLKNLEDIMKENFEELNEVVLKVNKLRKDMKDIRAKVFDINRGNAYCSCKPARIILEEDIKHLEEELHKHSILLKNLRKTNLALHLQNLSAAHGTTLEEERKEKKTQHEESNSPENLSENNGRNTTTNNTNNSYNNTLSLESVITTNSYPNVKDGDSCIKHNNSNKKSSVNKQNSSYLSHVYKPFNTFSASELKQTNLHDKIKVIEEQLNSLNHKMKNETTGNSSEGLTKDTSLVNKMMQQVIRQKNQEKENRKENKHKWKKTKEENHTSNESSSVNSEDDEEDEDDESSHSSTSISTDSTSEEESDSLYQGKNKTHSNKEIERSKNKMLQLLSLLNKKGNNNVIENIKYYVNAFGQEKDENQYNLQKVYDNLNIIKNQIKNTDDDTQKNILALIESQANEIKLFSNCVDELKNTIVTS